MISLGQHLLSSHGKCAVSIVDIAVAAHIWIIGMTLYCNNSELGAKSAEWFGYQSHLLSQFFVHDNMPP